MENYLYITYLLICCKKASVRLSPKTWEQIKSQILLSREQ
ncbi:NACHT C-terminal helical domain 2-containing protein [Stenomitos frigidus]